MNEDIWARLDERERELKRHAEHNGSAQATRDTYKTFAGLAARARAAQDRNLAASILDPSTHPLE